MKNVIGALYYGFLLSVVSGQGEIGNICTLESGGQGECHILPSCQFAMDELTLHKRFPKRCGFQGTVPIVCCPKNISNSTITPNSSIQLTSSTSSTVVVAPSTTTVSSETRTPGDISEQKCREYAKYVFRRIKPPILLLNPEEVTKNECGFKAIPLVVGGEKAKIREFPHQVLIGYKPAETEILWKCGGTIISEQYVMTAGHCLYSREFGEPTHVRMGITNLADIAHRQDHKVVERILHPNYTPPAHYNDIGLLKLEKPAQMTPFARPACLFRNHQISATKAIATGWGDTSYAGSGSDDLLKVTLALVSVKKCNNSYKNQITNGRKLTKGILNRVQLCAGSPDGLEKDTCQGDSGGPLQIYHTSDDVQCMYDIVGITSFGKACGIGKAPGVYTRVSTYIKWIEDTVWP